MRDISVKLYWIWTSGSGGIVLIYFLSRALVADVFGGAEPFVQFW